MDLVLKTVTGCTVVLKHKEYSAMHEGGVAFGKIIDLPGKPMGYWNRFGEAVLVSGANDGLKMFNLSGFSEEEFEEMKTDDEIEEESA